MNNSFKSIRQDVTVEEMSSFIDKLAEEKKNSFFPAVFKSESARISPTSKKLLDNMTLEGIEDSELDSGKKFK